MSKMLNALVVGATAVAGATAAEKLVLKRWANNPDPLDGRPVTFPVGEVRSVTTDDGATINTVTAGHGPTIVLVHGLTGNLADWGPIAERLVAQNFQVVGVDQRGHGQSTVGRDGFGVHRQAADLAHVLEQLDIAEATVAGHSMGGMAVMTLAVNHPVLTSERIDNLVLVSTSASTDNWRYQLALKLGSRNFVKNLPLDKRARLGAGLGALGRKPSLFMVDQTLASAAQCAPETRQAATAGLLTHDVDQLLDRVTTPTVVICGTHDRLTPLTDNEYIAATMPNALLEIVVGAGHMVIYERARHLADIIARHANKVDLSPAAEREPSNAPMS